MSQIKITQAVREDCRIIHDFIVKLAEYEKAKHRVTNSVQKLEKDGFEEPRRFWAKIAWDGQQACGMALYFYRYSTWEGLSLYLEDLWVEPDHRGRGTARRLMAELALEAKENNCSRYEWQVLNWNEKAIQFYKSLGAVLDGEWINCRMDPADFPDMK